MKSALCSAPFFLQDNPRRSTAPHLSEIHFFSGAVDSTSLKKVRALVLSSTLSSEPRRLTAGRFANWPHCSVAPARGACTLSTSASSTRRENRKTPFLLFVYIFYKVNRRETNNQKAYLENILQKQNIIMKLAVLPLTTVAALGAGPGSASVTQTKQTCEDAPCANGGTCIPSDNVSPPKF